MKTFADHYRDSQSNEHITESTRRDFIKKAAGAVVGAAALPPSAAPLSVAKKAISPSISSILSGIVYDITEFINNPSRLLSIATQMIDLKSVKSREDRDIAARSIAARIKADVMSGKINPMALSIIMTGRDDILASALTAALKDSGDVNVDTALGVIDDYLELYYDKFSSYAAEAMPQIYKTFPAGDVIYDGKVILSKDAGIANNIFQSDYRFANHIAKDAADLIDYAVNGDPNDYHGDEDEDTEPVVDVDYNKGVGQRRDSAWYESTAKDANIT